MKKILISLLATLLTLGSYAQGDVTTFLGIPVDGFKSEMRQKLIAKGFTPKKEGNTEYFEGEFNGMDVQVFIVTNNNKVYRIMLCDVNTQDEANIKNRFNRLVSQFENNDRYLTLKKHTIPDTEDISYEMTVHKKTYEASYYQNIDLSKLDTVAIKNKSREYFLKKYTPEQFENPTEEMKNDLMEYATKFTEDLLFKKPVWFRICENYGEYYIAMYYDNEYNKANGEDL